MVSGVPPQPFREDSLVNERVNMPECRYAELVQICRTDGYYANVAKAYKKNRLSFYSENVQIYRKKKGNC